MKNAREEIEQALIDHRQVLVAYAVRLCHHSEQAEDLFQDAAARSLDKTHLYEAGTNPIAWLRIILRNEYFRNYRRSRILYGGIVNESLTVAPSQESSITWNEVVVLLAKLPKAQRQALLNISSGDSYEEIAAKGKCFLGTAKSRVSRGRATLRELVT